MRNRRKKVIRNALIILLIGALYGTFTMITGIGIPCPFHSLTGLKCPGCGTSRMFLSLFKLDIRSAFSYNQAVFCLLPVILFTMIRKIYLYIKTGSSKDHLTDILIWIMVPSLMLFGIIRNII